MQNKASLFTLSIIFFFIATTGLSAQYLEKEKRLTIHEEDNYDTFSAIYDEAGFKADIYKGSGTTSVAATQQRIHFIEIWTATEAWTALSDQEQTAYLEALAAPIESLMASGAEIISWGVNNEQTDQRADYDFFAIWSFPSQESVKGFEQAVAGSGWYTYFRQANMSGVASSPATVMEYLIKQ